MKMRHGDRLALVGARDNIIGGNDAPDAALLPIEALPLGNELDLTQ